MCEVVVTELLFGISLLKDSKKKCFLTKEFKSIIEPLEIVIWDRETSQCFSDIKSLLHKNGNIIPDMDIAIAAHSCRYGYILVTDNIKDFKRIKSLKVENWKN